MTPLPDHQATENTETAAAPTLGELTRFFMRLGLLSFGGPAAQIALMHRELVDARRWLTEKQYLGALSFCMLLPGPEAMQLCTYAGWRLRGVVGGFIAGGLFVLPGAVLIFGLALLYARYGTQPLVQDAFLGIKAAVIVIVLQALLRLSRRALVRPGSWAVALLAFLGLFAVQVPFPAIIATAALWGAATAGSTDRPAEIGLTRTTSQTGGVVVALMALWALPLALAFLAGAELLLEIGLFFSKLAVVTFGGAYSVLAYMTQEVVQSYGWLTTEQMIDALGLAETTPGPLILVTEFVGALTGHAAGGWSMALAAAAMTLWVTFVPCFLWIFAGAPYVDWMIHQPRLKGALDGITAAVVGVITSLSLWFSLHVFFREIGTASLGPIEMPAPVWTSFRADAAVLAILAVALLLWRKASLPSTLAIMAICGLSLGALT